MHDVSDRFRHILGRYLDFFVRNRHVLLAIPSVVVIVGVGSVLGFASVLPNNVRTRYLDAARGAMKNEKMDLAKVYYGRLIEQGTQIDPADELNWAAILQQNGESAAAQRILDRLAPDKEEGYLPAHRLQALRIASSLSKSRDSKELERLQWHLSQLKDDKTVETNKLWAMFYLAVGQPKAGLARMGKAAEVEGELWYQVAILAKQVGDAEFLNLALKNAETFYLQALEKNPFDFSHRVLLTYTLLTLDRVDDAQKLIDQGLALQNIPELHQGAADILLYRFDKWVKEQPTEFSQSNRLLSEAFRHSPNYSEVYKRLLDMYQKLDSAEQRTEMRNSLEDLVSEGIATPFAHFSLGSIEWLEKDTTSALWHLEKAYQLDSSLLEVGNNLAWTLASSESPDLPRAYELAKSVVDRAPQQIRFRDTLASILMKQERWEEALVEFERVLTRSPADQKQQVHENLATIYEQLGRQSLADLHRKRAEEK